MEHHANLVYVKTLLVYHLTHIIILIYYNLSKHTIILKRLCTIII